MRELVGTYRLQLHEGFRFDDAATAVPFLAELGISHLYLSPVLRAAKGSTHGYDVVDVESVSEVLGGRSGFLRLCEVAASHGLGIVLDIVPNHLAITDRANRWWWEVLAYGPRAAHAPYFDIDWQSPEHRLRSKIVLPVLADHYGRAVDSGVIRLQPDDEELVLVCVGDVIVLPLSPAGRAHVLRELARVLRDDLLSFVARSLAGIDADERRTPAETSADVGAAVALALDRLHELDPDGVTRREVIARISRHSDELDSILDAQHYRLARWQVASQELDYRRFFDINTLVALQTERPEVFEATHRVVGELVGDGLVDGLRVDHIDGLVDPAGYCERLRELAPEAWLVVEKILAAGEALPPWPVDGTTGYDFAAITTPFLIDPRGEGPLTDAYRRLTGDELDWQAHAVAAKDEVLRTVLGSDVARLTELLVRVSERRRRYRDFTRDELREGLVAVAAHTSGYRSYMRWAADGSAEREPRDSAYVRHAIAAARRASPALDGEVFDLLDLVLGFGTGGQAERELALRFQQLTGPATAKGEEDTAMYRACRLLALDEVGHDPSRFSVDPDELHAWAAHMAQQWPRTMLTTSTHDTKRAEDVRARLAVLAEVPDELTEVAERVCVRAETRHDLDGHTAWFVLQTVVGAWPAGRERLWPAVEKSFREAKLRTSWLRPQAGFEQAAAGLLDDLLGDPALSRKVHGLAERVTPGGRENSLVLTALRCTLPGVPDTYQGCDRWDLSLVDPDNRRPVDLAAHDRLLTDSSRRPPAECWMSDPDSGSAKQALLRTLLHLRRRGAWAFGGYEPLPVDAPQPSPAIAYRRGHVVVVLRRFPLCGRPMHEDAVVDVPGGTWRDVCSGSAVRGGTTRIAALTARFPVAVLETERA